MNSKKSLQNRIRGWFPQEPQLPAKRTHYSSDNRKLEKQQVPLTVGRIFSILLSVLLIGLGAVTAIYNAVTVEALKLFSVFTPILSFFVQVMAFWIVIFVVVSVTVIVWATRKEGILGRFFRRNLTPRRLLPYGVAAAIIFSAYLAGTSGIQFGYAVPIALMVSGILVFRGLKRFAVTVPAFLVLLISMILLGTAFAGTSVVNYVGEDRYLTSADAPNVNTLNFTAYSMAGNMQVYFTDDPTQICHIAFLKAYGTVTSGRSTGYYGQSNYDNEPATKFNYTVEDGQANVTAWSYTVLVNITVNQNVRLNLNLQSYFGDIIINVPPGVSTIQSLNLTTEIGNINLQIPDTTSLQSITAKTNMTLQAAITSQAQNQDATIQLRGGTVKLNLNVANVRSEVSAYQTSQWGTLQATAQGFTVLNQDNTYFNAQTPSYDTSNLRRLDVNATSDQSTRPSMGIIASFNQK